VLEATFICFRAPAWHVSLTSQAVKAPKLHFFDSGLACHLLGIESAEQLRHHPLRGAVFESWVASELYKARAHRGLEARLYHYRDAKRLEVDLLVEAADAAVLIEAKSAATVASDFFDPLRRLSELMSARRLSSRSFVVYGGDQAQNRTGVHVVPWNRIGSVR
jgi:predicted AAA+ superfamily ATPase